MSNLQSLFSAEFTYALGWTILHSFWQCALVALLLAVVLRSSKKLSSNTRYLFACGALVLCFAISVETFVSYLNLARQARVEQTLELLGVELPQVLNAQSHMQQWLALADGYLLWIVNIWLVGCAFLSLRNLVDYLQCVKLQRAHSEIQDGHWQTTVNRLAHAINFPGQVVIRISDAVDVPSTLGYFKPLILIPAGLLTNLSQAQVEVILLHELGHIRRNDYVVGLLQMLLKTFFFFNPMALWISAVIDEERENACDDIAIGVCKDALLFSKTLKEFAEMNTNKNLNMAISNNKMHLLARIKRQFTQRKSVSRAIEKLIASSALVLCCAAATVYAQTNSPAQAENFNQQLTETLLQSPTLTKLPADERLAAAKNYLIMVDTHTTTPKPEVTQTPTADAVVVATNEYNTLAKEPTQPQPLAEQQPKNMPTSLAAETPQPETLPEVTPLAAAELSPITIAEAEKVTGITVFGKLPNKRTSIYAYMGSYHASDCSFSVTRSNADMEREYLQSFYGDAYRHRGLTGGGMGYISDLAPFGSAEQDMSLPQGCSFSDASFAAGRHYIARKDKSLDLAYAAYEAGDYPNAVTLFKKSYRKMEYDQAAFMLGTMYLFGMGARADTNTAINWFTKVAETRYKSGQDSPGVFEMERASLKVQSQIILARIYMTGLGIAKNPKRAEHWYEAAADLDYAPAHYVLGKMNQSGYADDKNKRAALRLYTKAAEAGYAPAQYQLAEIYFTSEDTPANRQLAFKWYQHAAQNNYLNPMRPHAQLALAEIYDQGRGTPRDSNKALIFYKLAAVSGHPDAQNALAIYFYAGEIVAKDLALARRLFSVSAEQQQPDAMYNLALMLQKGEGGEVDLVKAYVWLNCAAKLGHSKAPIAATKLDAKLTPEQKLQAQNLLSAS